MTEKGKTILNSICAFPPIFITDYSFYRNCYAHALNCMYEDMDYSVYSPGAISATFTGADMMFDDNGIFFFDEDLFIKLIKRDCSFLSINAICCSFNSKLEENAYKIVATYSKSDNDFHFIRQNADGLWSHKPGFGSKRNIVKSEILEYHGESHIELHGVPYRVLEIMQLQRI